VPRIHRSREGQLSVDDAACTWCVLEHIEGTYFEGTEDELVDAAANIGGLSRVLREGQTLFAIPDSIEVPGETGRDFLEDLSQRRAEWPRLFGESGASVLESRWRVIVDSMEEVLGLSDGPAMDRGLCHIDLHPHNLLMADGRLKGIIDLRSFMQAAVPVALAFNAFKLLRQSVTLLQPAITRSAVAHRRHLFLDGLPKEYVREHRGRLAVLARAEILRRLLLILAGASEWNSDIPVHADALIEAEFLFSQATADAGVDPESETGPRASGPQDHRPI
jgi:hypothetical protein